ncbi:MAG: YbjN domain-containing protein, partial [Atopobiaceae bacterium]|nr:YbjN domain-containing protein [Atopobiaceae bacterium]
PANGKGDTVHGVVPSVARYPGDARARGLELCNKISQDKRWIRAYIDNDDDLMIDADMYVTGGDFAEDVRSLVAMMMSVIDDIYEDTQRTQWG